MKKTIALLASVTVAAIVTLTGCARYSHSRSVGNTTEKTAIGTFFVFGKAAGIESKVVDANYQRILNVGSLSGQVDPTLQSLIAAGLAAYLRQGMAAQPGPVPSNPGLAPNGTNFIVLPQ